MEPKIVKKEALHVIGPEIATTTADGKNFSEIPAFWGRFLSSGDDRRIPNKVEPNVSYGIGIPLENGSMFQYMIGFEVSSIKEVPEGLVARTIPAGEYALFTAKGKPQGLIEKTLKHIYGEWLPKSGRQRTEGPGLEVYDTRRMTEDVWEVDILTPLR